MTKKIELTPEDKEAKKYLKALQRIADNTTNEELKEKSLAMVDKLKSLEPVAKKVETSGIDSAESIVKVLSAVLDSCGISERVEKTVD